MGEYRVVQVLAGDCLIQDEEKFKKLQNEGFYPLMLKYKGIKKITNYQIVNTPPPPGEQPAQPSKTKYLAVIEFANQEEEAKFAQSSEIGAIIKWSKESGFDKMFDLKWLLTYETIKTWEK
jgi:hypothetical protein